MPQRLVFNLFATDGFIDLPTDPTGTLPRERVYIFGFVGGLFKTQRIDRHGAPIGPQVVVNPQYDTSVISNLDALRGKAVIPSPRIDMDVGDELYITLVNLGLYQTKPPILDVHTVHIHGGHVATQLDGVPETSWGLPVTPPGRPAITVTYYFKPENPGTYFYHCHQEASEHVQMGMYGALIVYPSLASLAAAGIAQDPRTAAWCCGAAAQSHIPPSATNRNFAYNTKESFFNSDWVLLFSDIDSTWHKAVLEQSNFNPVDYKPNYWLVNGRAFPDTLLPTTLPPALVPNYGYSIPPGYEAYVKVSTGNRARGKPPDRFLLRLINIGYQPVPFHVHGWHGMVVGKDANPRTAGDMNFTTLVGSGESYDLVFVADDKRKIYADYIFCGRAGLPSLKEQVATATAQSIAEGTFIPPFPGASDLWSNIALETSVGRGGFIPPYDWVPWNYGSAAADSFMFPQFYIAHNHDDYKVTNDGSYPGGQLIFIETDFPRSNYKAIPPVVTEPAHVCRVAGRQ